MSNKKKRRCCFITLGCRVNQYESDAMAELMANDGFEITDNPRLSDVCVINTCTVTNVADRKSRQMISKARRLNENAKIIVCGCYSQRYPEAAAALEGVSAVLGSCDKIKIAEIVSELFKEENAENAENITNAENNANAKRTAELPRIYIKDVMREHTFEQMSAVYEGRTRAYLKIQDGCNMFCAYCAIPYARGALRSRSLESLRSEVEKLNSQGYSEVVLTGIHLMSYGRDFGNGTNIIDAVNCFDGLDNIKRIRFGSLEPHLMNDEIIEKLAGQERICRQFHLSLQSGSDTVLDRMRRGYTSNEYYNLVVKLRRAFGGETAITTDIIAGFPGETETEFNETAEFMKKVKFARTHIFPYSRRSGTKAADMAGQLSNSEKAERAKKLIAVGKALEREYLKDRIGETVDVLIEKSDGGISEGCTDTYVKVKINEKLTPNTFVSVKINQITEEKNGELSLL